MKVMTSADDDGDQHRQRDAVGNEQSALRPRDAVAPRRNRRAMPAGSGIGIGDA